ncbi:MAG: hypothetical protein ACW98Y_14660 [Candidatus Thorarchaeota archaeon]|jgi:hypothetical protein
MKPDYVVYNNYDPMATCEITVRDYLLRSLERLDRIFEFLSTEKRDFVDSITGRMIESLSGMVEDRDIAGLLTEYIGVLEELPFLGKQDDLGSLALRFVLEQLNLSKIEEGKTRLLFVDVEKGDNIIPYTALTHLVDLAGREEGIELWKGYVELMAKNASPRELGSFKEMRDGMARMGENGGFAFTVHDFDENKFVGRFDKCVVYDSLKDQDDQELAYYATCYVGGTIGNRRDWCVRMRRTQTLFSADYCDELYWNREVHDEPEQPSLEFTGRMVIE